MRVKRGYLSQTDAERVNAVLAEHERLHGPRGLDQSLVVRLSEEQQQCFDLLREPFWKVYGEFHTAESLPQFLAKVLRPTNGLVLTFSRPKPDKKRRK